MAFTEEEDNLFRIEVPLPDSPLRSLNAYLVRADAANRVERGRSLLIDNGFNRPECRDALLTALRKLGVSLRSLDFFVTHLHADHCGLTSTLLQAAGKDARVFASAEDASRINMNTRQSSRAPSALKRMLTNGMPENIAEYMTGNHPGRAFATDSPCPFTPAAHGDIFQYGNLNLKVLHMPGHTPGMLCLYDKKKKLLFSSDHVLADITPNITPWSGIRDSLGKYLASLKKTTRLDVSLCLPGHRSIPTDCKKRIAELENHHAERLEEIRAILDREGALSAYAVASKMVWSIRAKSWKDFPKAQQWFACGEALAHLMHLQARGETEIRKKDGIARYALAGKKDTKPENAPKSENPMRFSGPMSEEDKRRIMEQDVECLQLLEEAGLLSMEMNAIDAMFAALKGEK